MSANPSKKSALKSWMPAALWACLIMALSSVPGKDMPDVAMPHADKLAHFVEYAILSYLIARALLLRPSNISLAKAVIFSIIIALLYAALDELHQYLIPGRTPDLYDFLMDFAGAVTGAFIYKKRRCKCRS